MWTANPAASAVSYLDAQGNQRQLEEAEKELSRLQRQALIAEAADQIEDEVTNQAYNRFEIWTGSLFGFFSVLITILVIVFGFRTEKAAAAAATIAAQKELQEIKMQITRLLGEAEIASRDAGKELQRARDHADSAERDAQAVEVGKKKIEHVLSIVESLSRSAKPNEFNSEKMTPVESEAEEQALSISQNKSEDELTIEDYRLKLRDTRRSSEDGQKLLSLSSEMEEKFGHDDEALLFALSHKGEALMRLSRNLEAVKTFDRILEKYSSEHERISDKFLADIYVDKARALSRLGLYEDSEQQFNSAILVENELYGEASLITMWTRYWAAESVFDQGSTDRAAKITRDLLELAKEKAGDEHILTLQLRTLAAKISLEQGRAAEAQADLLEILQVHTDNLDEDSPYIDVVRRQLERATQLLNSATLA